MRTFRDNVAALIARGLMAGDGRMQRTNGSLISWRWDLSGNCETPWTTSLWGRVERGTYTFEPPAGQKSLYLDIVTRCRKCERCRKVRENLWTHRARAETASAVRTWFGTLTLSPEWHYAKVLAARGRVSAQGVDYEALSQGERFALEHNAISPELTKMLKRIRDGVGIYPAPLRFCLVTEAHASGVPHYHLLLHELSSAYPITHKTLASQWRLGFSKWKLVTDPRGASYVTKYLAKESLARVRASERYGECLPWIPSMQSLNEIQKAIMTPQKPEPVHGLYGA